MARLCRRPVAAIRRTYQGGGGGADPPSTPGHQTDSVVSAWPVSFSVGVITEANPNCTGELSHYVFPPTNSFECVSGTSSRCVSQSV